MMKSIFVTIILVLGTIVISAQDKSKTIFYLHPQAALLNGDQSVSGQVLMSGGIEKKALSFGIGAAIDYYKLRSAPVFADMRVAFGKDRSVFSYLNIGPNIAWPLESQSNTYWMIGGSTKSNYTTGLFTDIGIGYRFRTAKKNVITMSMGYSMKTVNESHIEAVYGDFPPYTATNHERKTTYTFNRLALRLGIKL